LHLVLQPANRLFESCTGYNAIEVLGKNWCATATAQGRACAARGGALRRGIVTHSR
jgi:hypothetical protein